MVEYLHSINLHIFDNLIKPSPENTDELKNVEAKQTILFILCAFSEESPMLILRQDDKTEKEGICDYLQIPEIYRSALLNLKDINVRRCVTTYVDQFSGPLYRLLVLLKIQLNDYQVNLTNFNYGAFEKLDDDGKKIDWHYDFKEHSKAVLEVIRLSKEIDKLEKEIRSQVKRMEAMEAMKEWKNKSTKKMGGARSGNVEGSKFIT